METLSFELTDWEYLAGLLIPLGIGLYKFAQNKGLKLISADTIKKYKENYEFLEDLRKHISVAEWNAIIEQGKLLKSKKSRTQAEVMKFGLLVINAIITDEEKTES